MRTKFLAVVGTMLLVLAACGDDGDDDSDDTGATAADDTLQIVTATGVGAVLDEPDALEQLVDDLVAAFAEEQPDIEIETATAPSADDLREVIEADGADMVVAPRIWIRGAPDAEPLELGRTLAVMAVADGNPEGYDESVFAADSDARTVICGPDTTLGNFSLAILSRAGVSPDPATVENDCDEEEILGRIADGELDAGFMYRGGVETPEGVELIPISDDRNLMVFLAAAALQQSDDTEAFVSFIESDEAVRIIESHGYLP